MTSLFFDTPECRDTFLFFRKWLSDPLNVGAIAPSGRALGDIITSEISSSTGHVIELGPGTGTFTEKLISRGVPPENLTLIEQGANFVEHLKRRFPDVRVVNMDAAHLKNMSLLGHERAGAIISGLPLLSMPARKIIAILAGSFAQMRSGGAFYQFTYAGRSPVPRVILDRLGLRATLVGGTIRNLPPASVYRFTSRKSLRPPMDSVNMADETQKHGRQG